MSEALDKAVSRAADARTALDHAVSDLSYAGEQVHEKVHEVLNADGELKAVIARERQDAKDALDG